MKERKEKLKIKAVYKCGCKEEIPEHGLTCGKRCPEHNEQLSKKIIREL